MTTKCLDPNLLVGYILDELTDEEICLVEEHVSTCSECSYILTKLAEAEEKDKEVDVKIPPKAKKEIEALIDSFQPGFRRKPKRELLTFLINAATESFENDDFEDGIATLKEIAKPISKYKALKKEAVSILLDTAVTNLVKTEKIDAVIQCLELAKQIDPANRLVQRLFNYSYAKKAKAFEKEGKPDPALELFRKVTAIEFPTARSHKSKAQKTSLIVSSTEEQILKWSDIHGFSQIFNGHDTRSLNVCIDAIQQFADRLPPSYDAVWPLLEWWEQVGQKAWIHQDTMEVFIERYADMCINTRNSVLKGALTWGVNEFLERGTQKGMGLAIARRILPSADSTIYRVLHILYTLREPLRDDFAERGCELPPLDKRTSYLIQMSETAIRQVDEWTQSTLFRLREFPQLSEMKELIDYWHTAKSDKGFGIFAMGQLKRVLSRAIRGARGNYELIKEICVPILKKVDQDPHFASFLAIESLEAVRDKVPAQCARIMAVYLLEVITMSLTFGIGVCISEGFEEEGESSKVARYRVVRDDDGFWKVVGKYPENKHLLDCFFPLAAEALNARNDWTSALAEWMNNRLDQHPSLILQ